VSPLDDAGNHSAYPYIDTFGGDLLMVPDRGNGVEIYELDVWPDQWTLVETVIEEGWRTSDPTPVRWRDRWYMFLYDADAQEKRLYYSDEGESLTGRTWSEHPNSPIISGTVGTRNGGRPLYTEDTVHLITQDQDQDPVRRWIVTDLSPTTFTQTEAGYSPIYESGADAWRSDRAHHADLGGPVIGGQRLALVDGNDGSDWSVGVFTTDGAPGNRPLWTEEAGSPYTATGNSITISNLETFDRYLIDVTATDLASSANDVSAQWNGVTTDDYIEIFEDGTTTSNETEMGPLTRSGGDGSPNFTMRFWNRGNQPAIRMLNADIRASFDVPVGSRCTAANWPLTSLTFDRGANTEWRVQIFGRNI
jgi:hypothetical protein